MIPIIIITESGESFNYFSGRLRRSKIKGYTDKDNQYTIEHELTSINGNFNATDELYECVLIVFECGDSDFRDKVLDLLHKEVADCFIYNINRTVQESTPLIQQYKFQIHI